MCDIMLQYMTSCLSPVPQSYVAQDTVGGKVSEEAFVHVLVRSPGYWNSIMQNQPPTALPATFRLNQDEKLFGHVNATDDFDTAEQLLFSVSRPPLLGTVEMDGPDFTYIPERAAFGQDTFTVKVSMSVASGP